jgi:phage baseplate assembly protein W
MDIQFLGSLTISELYNTRNDISFNTANDITLVSGRDYAKQKIIKSIVTRIGDDVYFPNYGTLLKDYLFTDIQDPTIQNDIVNTILGALTYVETQERSTSPSELISSIDNIEIVPDSLNQTLYIRMDITLQDFNQLAVLVGGQ